MCVNTYPDRPVVVPAPGNQSRMNPNPTANSPPPKFDGWGTPFVRAAPVTPPSVESPVESLRSPLPTPPPTCTFPSPSCASPTQDAERDSHACEKFSITGSGFMALVECEYERLVARENRDLLPISLFSYLMTQAWWKRVLWALSHSRELDDTESQGLSSLWKTESWVTPRVRDYLSQIGSFDLNGVHFQFDIFTRFSRSSEFLSSGFPYGAHQSDLSDFQLYSDIPVPGVSFLSVISQIGAGPSICTTDEELTSIFFPHICLFPGSKRVVPGPNLLGWHPSQEVELRFEGGIEERDQLIDLDGQWTFLRDHGTPWLVSPSLHAYASRILQRVCDDVVLYSPSLVEIPIGSPLQLSFLCIEIHSSPPPRTMEELTRCPGRHPLRWTRQSLASATITSGVELQVAFGCGFGVLVPEDGPYGHIFSPFLGIDPSGRIWSPPITRDYWGVFKRVPLRNRARTLIDHYTEVYDRSFLA